MRRRIRREFTWQNGAWVQINEVRYIYNGNLVIQERDSFNIAAVSYTRGTDLSRSFEGAGGSTAGLSLNGDNTFTTVAQDSLGRNDTNVVTAYLPASPTLMESHQRFASRVRL